MTIYYSASTRGFYNDAVHTAGQIPKDKVQVSDGDYAALLVGQSDGKLIVPDGAGGPVLADPPVDLAVYANQKQWALVLAGFTATVNGQPCHFDCDGQAASFMASTVIALQLPDPPASVNWQLKDRSFVTIAAADFIPLAKTLRDFVQATFDALKVVLAGIEAGTITDIAAIDAAAWPVSHD